MQCAAERRFRRTLERAIELNVFRMTERHFKICICPLRSHSICLVFLFFSFLFYPILSSPIPFPPPFSFFSSLSVPVSGAQLPRVVRGWSLELSSISRSLAKVISNRNLKFTLVVGEILSRSHFSKVIVFILFRSCACVSFRLPTRLINGSTSDSS